MLEEAGIVWPVGKARPSIIDFGAVLLGLEQLLELPIGFGGVARHGSAYTLTCAISRRAIADAMGADVGNLETSTVLAAVHLTEQKNR